MEGRKLAALACLVTTSAYGLALWLRIPPVVEAHNRFVRWLNRDLLGLDSYTLCWCETCRRRRSEGLSARPEGMGDWE